jgi:hypothetical protein
MKKYKNVVVVGCSFSASDDIFDFVNPGETYGEIIANHFGAKYYDLAKGGTSNQRMNRVILNWCSKNKDKFNDTLIIFGMTALDRFEMWNNKSNYWWPSYLGLYEPLYHRDTDWQRRLGVKPHEIPPSELVIDWPIQQRKNYFKNFYNENAVFLQAIHIIVGLQSFFKVNNIDSVFFDALRPIDKFWESDCDDKEDELGHKLLFDSLVSQENWYKHPEYESMADFTIENPEMRVSKNDNHPNTKAHKYWAEHLLEFINEKV